MYTYVQVAPLDDLGSTVFTMVDTASQTYHPQGSSATAADYTNFDVGDSVSFQVTLDLPPVSIDGKSDLIFEVFGMDPDSGKSLRPYACPYACLSVFLECLYTKMFFLFHDQE